MKLEKIEITFKDPDGPYDAIKNFVQAQLDKLELTADERELVRDARIESISKKLGKWLTFGEYITIEFDLEKGTAQIKDAG